MSALSGPERALLEAIREARARRAPLESRGEAWQVDLAGAYRVQEAAGDGRRPLGYKLGLVSPAKQAQMGLTSPIYGRVWPGMMLEEGAVPLQRLLQPRVEPEVAVVLKDPIPPPSTPGAAWQAVGAAFLAADLLDSVWTGYRFSAPEVVADNASGGGFVLGDRQLLPDALRGSLRMYLDGQLVSEGPLEALGDIPSRLAWLAAQAGGLEAGQVVFLGSPGPAAAARPGVLEVVGPGGAYLVGRLEG